MDCILWLFSLEGLRKTPYLFLSLAEEFHSVSGITVFSLILGKRIFYNPNMRQRDFCNIYLLQTKTLLKILLRWEDI